MADETGDGPTPEEVDTTKELYKNDDINSPYDDVQQIQQIGFTSKAIVELCKYLQVPVHISLMNSSFVVLLIPSTRKDNMLCSRINLDSVFLHD